MNQQTVAENTHITITLPVFSIDASSMVYTYHPLTCNSCGETYEEGCLFEIRCTGLYCNNCFRSIFEGYFKKHPEKDYVLARGVCSLAGQKKAKGRVKSVSTRRRNLQTNGAKL